MKTTIPPIVHPGCSTKAVLWSLALLLGTPQLARSQSYCTAGANTPGAAGITEVVFNEISNASVATPAYSNFTAQITNVVVGNSYQLSVKVVATGTLFGSPTNTAMAWIDWNQNGTFEASESYALGTLNAGLFGSEAEGYTSASPLNITVPGTALGGNTRMRVRTRRGSAPSACGNINHSEAEDYTVNVIVPVYCSGTPAPGLTTTSTAIPCPGIPFTLGMQNNSADLGLTYQWQSSTTGLAGSYANNGLGTAPTQVTSATVPTWYRVVVTCSGQDGISTPVTVSPSPFAAACYCAVTANSNDATGITRVQLGTIDNSTSSAPAYSDFSNLTTVMNAGDSYPLTVTANAPGFTLAYITAWIDWDHSGVFDASESYDLGFVLLGEAITSSSPLGITVPQNAAGGPTIMRIRATNSTAPSACGNNDNSEAEDYMLNVIPPHNTCSTAFPVQCGQSYPGKTTGVAPSMPGSTCPFNGPASSGGQNWWLYTATGDNAVTFSTCGNADFDTRISVFSGADCASLACTAMNDDSPGCATGSSEVTINTTTGTTYWIAVHGAGAQEGSYTLSVSCGAVCPPQANDVCASATSIANHLRDGSNTPATYTNACATVDGPTSASGAMPVSGVWFNLSTGDFSHALLSVVDHGSDAQYSATTLNFALFSGACNNLGAEDEVAVTTDADGFNIVDLAPNSNYLLLVYNNGSSGVAGTFGLMLEHAAHNDASIAALLSPAPGLLCGSTMAPEVTLLNNGDNDLTSVQINYGLSGGPVHTYNWTGNLAYGQSVNVTLPTVPTVSGTGQTLAVSTSMPNGVADDMPANDSQSILVDVSGEPVVLKIKTDNDASFFYWEIYDQAFSMVATGGYYPLANNLYSENLCLSTDNGNCYSLALYDDNGDGLCCNNGNGFWELRTTSGRLLLRDLFDGSIDGYSSPSGSTQTPSYGSGHNFCLPAGPANIMAYECGVFTNGMYDKVYSNKVTGATQYQFEFSNPDAGYMRRIARPHNYVVFYEMVSSPLVPGVVYFTRVRTNEAGPLASAHWGSGCDLGLGIAQVVQCTQLIQAPAYGHSCNETRSFNAPYNYLYARPVTGANTYTFKITGDDGNYNSGIEFVRNTYILALGWGTDEAPALTDQTTYQVQVRVTVNGIEGAYCGNACNVIIDNNPGLGMRLAQTEGQPEFNLWPNPNNGQHLNVALSGLDSKVSTADVRLMDLTGRVALGTQLNVVDGAINSVIELGNAANGTYLLQVIAGGNTYTQRVVVSK